MTKIAMLFSPFLSLGSLARKLPSTTRNIENNPFYESLGAKLENFSITTGNSNFEDLEALNDLVQTSQNVLEIGGGYGRVIEGILELRDVQPKISVIEQAESCLKILRDRFTSNIRIASGSILTGQLGNDFDLALWMWSGIGDFNFDEQLAALQNINSQMAWGGTLAIELPADLNNTNATAREGRLLKIIGYGPDYVSHIPTQQQLIQLAKKSGFAFQIPRYYTSSTGRPRVIYLLKKSCI